jgi:hypothetical protein
LSVHHEQKDNYKRVEAVEKDAQVKVYALQTLLTVEYDLDVVVVDIV